MGYDVLKAVAGGSGGVLVTVVRVSGSTPRAAGAKMAVLPDGTLVGTVGGGVLEARAIERARACIAGGTSDSIEVDLAGADAGGCTPVCGGAAELWIARVEDAGLLDAALSLLDRGRTAVLASRRDGAGSRPRLVAVLDAEGARVAGPADELDTASAAAAAASGATVLADGARRFYDPILPPERLLVLGGGHVGRAVAAFAGALDFRVTIADDRPQVFRAGLLPVGVEALQGGYPGVIEGFPFGPSTYVLVVTPGHLSDLDCVRALLPKEYRYLGLIGSRRKVRMVRERLVAEGHDPRRVEAIHAPVGLAIGAETPAEIAVSILAEMIAVRRDGAQARARRSPSRPSSSASEKQ